MITMTAPAETILGGRQAIVDAFAQLRRRESWRSIVWGAGQIEVEFSPTGRVHTHGHLVVLHDEPLDRRAMNAAWRELLGDVPGRVHVLRIARRWADASRTFQPDCLLRTHAGEAAVARARRCGAVGARDGATRTAMGAAVRAMTTGEP
jgi:hypothetical protein